MSPSSDAVSIKRPVTLFSKFNVELKADRKGTRKITYKALK